MTLTRIVNVWASFDKPVGTAVMTATHAAIAIRNRHCLADRNVKVSPGARSLAFPPICPRVSGGFLLLVSGGFLLLVLVLQIIL